eukprot:TRINITY_DN2838_c0_g1_i1.p1 TRINITY_DN2838_c0_g1~~TRINITY_DN2838_c0_g1_i1.p1  ORF type:complete len:542 (-),score=116.63 TRINITY_DN2838_c0_g1_i1:96-1721(-)
MASRSYGNSPHSSPGNQTPYSLPGNQTPYSLPGNLTPYSPPGSLTSGIQVPARGSRNGGESPRRERAGCVPVPVVALSALRSEECPADPSVDYSQMMRSPRNMAVSTSVPAPARNGAGDSSGTRTPGAPLLAAAAHETMHAVPRRLAGTGNVNDAAMVTFGMPTSNGAATSEADNSSFQTQKQNTSSTSFLRAAANTQLAATPDAVGFSISEVEFQELRDRMLAMEAKLEAELPKVSATVNAEAANRWEAELSNVSAMVNAEAANRWEVLERLLARNQQREQEARDAIVTNLEEAFDKRFKDYSVIMSDEIAGLEKKLSEATKVFDAFDGIVSKLMTQVSEIQADIVRQRLTLSPLPGQESAMPGPPATVPEQGAPHENLSLMSTSTVAMEMPAAASNADSSLQANLQTMVEDLQIRISAVEQGSQAPDTVATVEDILLRLGVLEASASDEIMQRVTSDVTAMFETQRQQIDDHIDVQVQEAKYAVKDFEQRITKIPAELAQIVVKVKGDILKEMDGETEKKLEGVWEAIGRLKKVTSADA